MTEHSSTATESLLIRARALAYQFNKVDGRPGAATVLIALCDEIERLQALVNAQKASKFSPGDPVEVRKQNDEIDEIVIRNGDVHIEQMSADSWFMGIDANDGSYWQFWFGAKNRKSHVNFRHTETVSAAEQAHGPSVSSTDRSAPCPNCGSVAPDHSYGCFRAASEDRSNG